MRMGWDEQRPSCAPALVVRGLDLVTGPMAAPQTSGVRCTLSACKSAVQVHLCAVKPREVRRSESCLGSPLGLVSELGAHSPR